MSAEGFFPSTCWSQIRPGDGAGTGAQTAAYEALARGYLGPIRAYLRAALRRSEHDADDLAQDFFAWMLESGFLGKADPSRGRFRAFLKVALKNYVADADRRARALVRGGGRRAATLNGAAAGTEDDGAPEPIDADAVPPEEALDRAWRAALVNDALAALETELTDGGREVVFRVFRDYLLEPGTDASHASVADRHGITRVDVQNHLQRARTKFQSHLRRLVLETVRTPDDLADELGWLLAAHARRDSAESTDSTDSTDSTEPSGSGPR